MRVLPLLFLLASCIANGAHRANRDEEVLAHDLATRIAEPAQTCISHRWDPDRCRRSMLER